jgi:hypothetical protein
MIPDMLWRISNRADPIACVIGGRPARGAIEAVEYARSKSALGQ